MNRNNNSTKANTATHGESKPPIEPVEVTCELPFVIESDPMLFNATL